MGGGQWHTAQIILIKTLTPPPLSYSLSELARVSKGAVPTDGSLPTEVFYWANSEVSHAFNLIALDRVFAPLCTKHHLFPSDNTHCLPASMYRHLRLSPWLLSHRCRTWYGYFLFKIEIQEDKTLRSRENGASSLWGNQAIERDWKRVAVKMRGFLR